MQHPKIAILPLLLAHASIAWAEVSVVPMTEELAFTVNDKPYGIKAFQILTQGIRQHSAEASDSKVLKGLIENHLFSQTVAHDHHGHAHSVQHYRQWQEYGMLLENLFPQVSTDAVRTSCIKYKPVTENDLTTVLGAKTNKLAMAEPVFSEDVIARAEKIILAEIQCKESETGTVTLTQVIDAADEAASLKLWRGELDTLDLLRNKVADVKLRESMLVKQKLLGSLLQLRN